MPVRKVKGGWQWGKSGKVYKHKSDAEKQGKAIKASVLVSVLAGGKSGKKSRF
jgi:hypothetical protein